MPPPEHADTRTGRAGEAEFLATYDLSAYTPTAHTVDVAVLTVVQGQLSVLLVERAEHPYRGYWALPGGFVRAWRRAAGADPGHPGETLDEAARREFHEETGVPAETVAAHLEQLATYGDPGRDPRGAVYSTVYVALAPDLPAPVAGSDAAAARYWPVADLDLAGQAGDHRRGAEYGGRAPRLAFDHALVLTDAVERVRAKVQYTTVATRFLAEPFTLPELYRVVTAVWGVAPGTLGNFMRAVLRVDGYVVPEDRRTEPTGRGGRPAMLYRRGPAWLVTPEMRRPPAP